MAHYTLAKEQNSTAFDRTLPPVLEIDPGDTVTFNTSDIAYNRLFNGESVEAIGLENFNRVTGPVHVRGAEPGDALRIEVLDVQVLRAWSVWLPKFGGLGAHTNEVRVMEDAPPRWARLPRQNQCAHSPDDRLYRCCPR